MGTTSKICVLTVLSIVLLVTIPVLSNADNIQGFYYVVEVDDQYDFHLRSVNYLDSDHTDSFRYTVTITEVQTLEEDVTSFSHVLMTSWYCSVSLVNGTSIYEPILFQALPLGNWINLQSILEFGWQSGPETWDWINTTTEWGYNWYSATYTEQIRFSKTDGVFNQLIIDNWDDDGTPVQYLEINRSKGELPVILITIGACAALFVAVLVIIQIRKR